MKKSQSQNYPISKKIILTVIKPKMTKEEIIFKSNKKSQITRTKNNQRLNNSKIKEKNYD